MYDPEVTLVSHLVRILGGPLVCDNLMERATKQLDEWKKAHFFVGAHTNIQFCLPAVLPYF